MFTARVDIVSHALWAGAASEALGRRVQLGRGTRYAIVLLAVAPDIVPILPLLAWVSFDPAPIDITYAYVTARAGPRAATSDTAFAMDSSSALRNA